MKGAQMNFSNEQKQIAVLLSHEPKTAEQLTKQLGLPYDKLMEEIKEMTKLNLIKQEGYPPKYVLAKQIQSELTKRKEIRETDYYKTKLKIIIEAQAIEQNLLEDQFKKIEDGIKKEPDFTIYSCELASIIKMKETEQYTGYLDITLTVKDFKALIKLMYFYGPVSVEVLSNQKISFDVSDFQEGLVDMANMIQSYNNYVLTLMNRKELNEFYHKLYEKK
jgi:hypothetical protein